MCSSCTLALAAFSPALASAADIYTQTAGANAVYSAPQIHQLTSPTPISADPQWAVTVLGGASAGDDRLIWLLTSPWKAQFRDDYFAGGAVSRKLVRFWKYFTVEAEVGFGARFGMTNSPETWGALYFRYDHFPWNNTLYTTVAVSTGLDYLSKLPPSETYPGDPTSHVLHYFSPEITFALPEFKQHEVLIRYHHRSGVFGTFNGVWGGSNVISLGYRYRFDR